MGTLKTLEITENVTEAVRIDGNSCAIMVTTTEASTVTVERSVDGSLFAVIPDVSLSVDGSDGLNLTDIVPGQWLRITSSGEMTLCKILY